ncbi:MAG: DUF4199 family protein [Bacteroidia bacterium]
MKSIFTRFLVPALILATPSFVLSLYNLTHTEQLQSSDVFRYFGLVNFVLSILILLFFSGKYRTLNSVNGNVTFKMIFSYAYRIVVISALYGFGISLVLTYTFKEENKKLSEIATEMQVKELVKEKGSISETDKHDLENRTIETLSNPVTSSFYYSLSILFFGIFHCLIISVFWILFKSYPSEIKN